MPKAVVVLLLLAAIGIGFALGRASAPEPDPPRVARSGPPPGPVGAAVHEALLTPDPLERAEALGGVLAPLGPESLDSVEAAFEAVVLEARDFEVQLFVEWWARFDAPAATNWAFHHHLGRNPSVLAAAVRAWARQDPRAAFSWSRATATVPYLQGAATAAVIWGWDESGQPGLWEMVGGLPDLAEQQIALTILVRRRILRDGVEAAARWAEQMPDDEPGDIRRLKLNTFRRLGSKLTDIDPALGTAWAEEVGEGRYGDGVYRRVAWSWVATDGQAAMEWLKTLPEGPRRDDAVDEAFRRWLNIRKRPALDWIAAQPDQAWLDPARLWESNAVGARDPVEGVEIARRIHEPELRNRAVFGVLRAWKVNDPEAADAWIATQELPPRMVSALESTEPVERPRIRAMEERWKRVN